MKVLTEAYNKIADAYGTCSVAIEHGTDDADDEAQDDQAGDDDNTSCDDGQDEEGCAVDAHDFEGVCLFIEAHVGQLRADLIAADPGQDGGNACGGEFEDHDVADDETDNGMWNEGGVEHVGGLEGHDHTKENGYDADEGDDADADGVAFLHEVFPENG